MSKKKQKLLISMGAMLGVTAIHLSGCGSEGNGESTEYTFWTYTSIDSTYYAEYNNNPALQYALENYSPEGKKISFDFWIPPAGTATDNYANMIGSGDYADVIENTIGDSPILNYQNGISIDLTDLVQENMPNYLAYLEAHPELRADAVTEIDGADHYLSIVSFNEDYTDLDWGFEYRRDWIAKYGKNPVTGADFTGSYTNPSDPDSWVDDVMFPSGGTDPITISDWEWMFEIFEKAQADLGIEDSYCISIQYSGSCPTGDLNASFGGGASGSWYRTLDNVVEFGPATDSFRAYLQCMATWYEKGWLDPHFNERTSDMFFSIDSTNVYRGKVGMWFGVTGQLGGRMDTGDELTSGICVYGASTPMNDIYGDESVQNKAPYCGWGGALRDTQYLVTTAAEKNGKDIPALLQFFDQFYTEEGALIRTLGLNGEQAATVDSTFYADYGLTDGAYAEQNGIYSLSSVVRNDSGALGDAVRYLKVPGITLVKNVDNGYAETYQHSLDQWSRYINYGYFAGTSMVENISDEDTNQINNISTKITTYAAQTFPEYIMGKKDPYSDDAWNELQVMLGKYGYQKVTDIYQKYADLSPLVVEE